MTQVIARADLKACCLDILDSVAMEHPSGHQGKLVARYVLRTVSGERIGLMFEKSKKAKPNLWVELRFAKELLDLNISFIISQASSLYQQDKATGRIIYGRHAAIKAMRDLANADLVRFTIADITQLQIILKKLTAL